MNWIKDFPPLGIPDPDVRCDPKNRQNRFIFGFHCHPRVEVLNYLLTLSAEQPMIGERVGYVRISSFASHASIAPAVACYREISPIGLRGR
jgi:hypothetical protein